MTIKLTQMLLVIFAAVLHVRELLDHAVVKLNFLLVMLKLLLECCQFLSREAARLSSLPQLVELLVFEETFVDVILVVFHLSLVRLVLLLILGLFRFIDVDDFEQIVC